MALGLSVVAGIRPPRFDDLTGLTATGLRSSSPEALSAFGFERAHLCDANYPTEEMALDAARRLVARIPQTIVFQEKWRLALTLVRRRRAAGLTLTAVVATPNTATTARPTDAASLAPALLPWGSCRR